MELRHVVHPYEPVFDCNSKVLILGSIPSVQSINLGFYYMHPQNRFWKMLGAILGEELYNLDSAAKKCILLSRNIALYDIVSECDIYGSSDSKVSGIVPSDISGIMEISDIRVILANGALTYNLIKKYHPGLEKITVKMPSTSPANAKYRLDSLVSDWSKIIMQYI